MTQRLIRPLLNIFGANWITMFSASLATVSAVAIFGFMLLGLIGQVNSPYIAMMALLVLPAILVLSLVLIPIGLIWERRKKALGKVESNVHSRFPVIDLNNTRTRRVFFGVGVLTFLNILIISIASFEGVAYMESVEFCGEVCHTVMEPEYQAYIGSPHSRVRCVECHIGPGAPWFVRSKLSGMSQLIAVTLHNYSRPIPTPVHNLRPSQDTCEECHWPGRFTGDRLKIIDRFSEDETNSLDRTVLLLHIGGGQGAEGIHSWHINPNKETYYYSPDEKRQEISWIQVRDDGEVIDYYSDEFETDQVESQNLRRMDCIDCHNRPTHIFELPETAMDTALSDGRINRSIPFIKRTGVKVLTKVGNALGSSQETVIMLEEFYRTEYPDLFETDGQILKSSFAEIAKIYDRNVFPEMKLSWATYPNNIGHGDFGPNPFAGCFRCHDGMHSSEDDLVIEMDCDTCHTILDPDVISELGIADAGG